MRKIFFTLVFLLVCNPGFSGDGHDHGNEEEHAHEHDVLPEGALAVVDVNKHEAEAMQLTLDRPFVSETGVSISLKGEIDSFPGSIVEILAPVRGLFLLMPDLYEGAQIQKGQKLGTLIPLPDEEFMDLDRLAFSAQVLKQKEQSELSRVENLISSQSASQKALIDAKANAQIAKKEEEIWRKHRKVFDDFSSLDHEHEGSMPIYATKAGMLLSLPRASRIVAFGGEALFRIQDPEGWLLAEFEATPELREIYSRKGEMKIISSLGNFKGFNPWLSQKEKDVFLVSQVKADSGLIAGMRVEGDYSLPGTKLKLCVAPQALIREGEDALLFTQEEDGHYAMRKIKLGEESRNCMQVVSGLRMEDQIVSGGVWQLYMKARMPQDGGGHSGHSH